MKVKTDREESSQVPENKEKKCLQFMQSLL